LPLKTRKGQIRTFDTHANEEEDFTRRRGGRIGRECSGSGRPAAGARAAHLKKNVEKRKQIMYIIKVKPMARQANYRVNYGMYVP
jgi:hypothetical protein